MPPFITHFGPCVSAILGSSPILFTLFTTGESFIHPEVKEQFNVQCSWNFGDGEPDIINDGSVQHTYTDGAPSHVVSIYDVDITLISQVLVAGDDITLMDVTMLPSLSTLDISSNTNLTSIDVTQNPDLYRLYCYSNPGLTSLDVTQNTNNFQQLYMHNMINLPSIDLTQNTTLRILNCGYNPGLTSLDVSQNVNLQTLLCNDNLNLPTVDISQNILLTQLNIRLNNWSDNDIDISTNTSLNTLYVNYNLFSSAKIDSFIIAMDANGASNGTLHYNDNTGDPTLLTYAEYNSLLSKNWTVVGTAPVPFTLFTTDSPSGPVEPEIATFTSAVCSWNWGDGEPDTIDNNSGTHTYTDGAPTHDVSIYGVMLSDINSIVLVSDNLTAIDITQNTALIFLLCGSNTLTSLNTTFNTVIQHIKCQNNNLTTLDVTQNVMMTVFWCYTNNLTTLDVTQNVLLDTVICESNNLTSLDLEFNPVLRVLQCGNNDYNIAGLDLQFNTALKTLTCGSSNLDVIDVTMLPLLGSFWLQANNISILDVTQNPNIHTLVCFSNNLSVLDISQNPLLNNVRCQNNLLTSTEIDDIIIQLDANGLSSGTLDYSGNAGNPTSTSLTAYNSLVGKSWTITGTVPV